jgi:hypothetical protein
LNSTQFLGLPVEGLVLRRREGKHVGSGRRHFILLNWCSLSA